MKKILFKFSKKEPVCMCKEGCCVGLGQEGGYLGESGRIVWNILKRGWNRREEWKQKFLKVGGGKLG